MKAVLKDDGLWYCIVCWEAYSVYINAEQCCKEPEEKGEEE